MNWDDPEILIDTIIFKKKDARSPNAVEDDLQTLFADTLESLAKATGTAKDHKVITLIIRR
ncbi:MAG: hypothetical protein ABF379_02810 [Akkermansiaceae bacterium]|jgi:hypothetical protein